MKIGFPLLSKEHPKKWAMSSTGHAKEQGDKLEFQSRLGDIKQGTSPL